jgi:AcrR family transcriptional regulator
MPDSWESQEITIMSPHSGPGRPRLFEDEQAFQQITQLLLESGMSSLTMPALAHRLGITHQSLGRRFVSKHQMLTLYVIWMHSRYEEQFQAAIANLHSPLERMWRILILPMGADITGGEPGRPAQWIVLNLELRRAPELTALLIGQQQVIGERLIAAIEEAVRDGLLRRCDPAVLAELLYAATLGGAVTWLLVGKNSDVHLMERACYNVLRPFLVDPVELPVFWLP